MRLQPYLAMLLLLGGAATADEGRTIALDIATTVRDGNLKVEPKVSGPAGKALRYEIDVRREGEGGSSNNSQSGRVLLDSSGTAQLASNSVSVGARDAYRVTVKVFDAERLVAEQSLRHP
jgi:hypothetical protein